MTGSKTRLSVCGAGLALTACCILSSTGCGKPENQGAAVTPSPVAVVVAIAERRVVPVTAELPARIAAAATVEVRANVEGRLTEMSFKEGNMVRKNQVLFRIDPRLYEAGVQSAGAMVEKAEADLEMAREQQRLVNAQSALRQAEAILLKANQDAERMKPLAARRAVPERDLDAAIAAQSSAAAAVEDARATVRTTTVGDRMGLRQAQAGLTAARASLAKAQMDLDETTIRAPISGLIGTVEFSVGNYVGRGESNRLATISPVDPINVVFGISETTYLRTVDKVDRRALARIELILADDSMYPFLGRYANIGRAVDEKTGTLLVEAQFPNPKGILLPGMTGRVRVSLENRPDAVLVPEAAVFDSQGSKAVYIVTPDNAVALRGVVIDGSYQGKSIVAKGLSGGESVIADGRAKVRPGQVVTTRAAHDR
jgi:membrane fusion protein (multidrug efflux system)